MNLGGFGQGGPSLFTSLSSVAVWRRYESLFKQRQMTISSLFASSDVVLRRWLMNALKFMTCKNFKKNGPGAERGADSVFENKVK